MWEEGRGTEQQLQQGQPLQKRHSRRLYTRQNKMTLNIPHFIPHF